MRGSAEVRRPAGKASPLVVSLRPLAHWMGGPVWSPTLGFGSWICLIGCVPLRKTLALSCLFLPSVRGDHKARILWLVAVGMPETTLTPWLRAVTAEFARDPGVRPAALSGCVWLQTGGSRWASPPLLTQPQNHVVSLLLPSLLGAATRAHPGSRGRDRLQLQMERGSKNLQTCLKTPTYLILRTWKEPSKC